MKCKICQKEFKSLRSLSKHAWLVHQTKAEGFYIDNILNGIKPTCKCGCGEDVKFLGVVKGYREYKRGHISRIHNNWGHNPKAIKKSHIKQKELYLKGILIPWNKGLTIDDPRVKKNIEAIMANQNRGENISKALKGKKKTQQHIQKLKESAILSWNDSDKRKGQSERKIKWMQENNFIKSKTEDLFESFLIDIFNLEKHIDYTNQYYVKEISGFYDFYLLKENILIEVDGDFWHCNPNTKYKEPKYEAQKKNLITDTKKNKWALDNNIQLIRFWESDIKNNPDIIMNMLKEII